MNLTMNYAHLKAASFAMVKKDIRGYLNGVHVGAGFVEGSDGYVLIRVEATSIESDGNYIIRSEDVVKMLRSKGQFVVIDNGVHQEAGVITAMERKYPDTSRFFNVSDETDKGTPGQYDPELLMKIKKAVQALGSKSGSYYLEQYGPVQHARVYWEDSIGRMIAAVMPWRP